MLVLESTHLNVVTWASSSVQVAQMLCRFLENAETRTLLCFSHSMCLTLTEFAGFNFLSAGAPASLEYGACD